MICAITVSKNYDDLLKITIPNNYKFFDRWYIVTQEDDTKSVKLLESYTKKYPNLQVLFYPLVPACSEKTHSKHMFTPNEMNSIEIPGWDRNHGADVSKPKFDKGGAIRMVQKFYLLTEEEPRVKLCRNGQWLYENTRPTLMTNDDLVLIIDCDILLPDNTIELLNKNILEEDTIYGATRHDCLFYTDTQKTYEGMPYHNWCIDGFFQLYKYKNKYLYKRSYSASVCDTQFANTFKHKQILNEIKCKHLGLPRINWNGRDNVNFVDDTDMKNLNSVLKHYKLPMSDDVESNRGYIRDYIRSEIYQGSWWNELPTQMVFIPGFSRCGTSSLVSILSQHPYIESYLDENPEKGSSLDFHRIKLLTSDMNFGVNWMFHAPHYVNHKTFNNLKLPEANRKVTYKYIFMKRNPVERAISEYRRYMDAMPSSLAWNWPSPGRSFQHNIESELEYLSGIDKNNYIEKLTECPTGIVCDGAYTIMLDHVRDIVGKDNVLVIDLESLINNQQQVASKIFKFLNLAKIETKPIRVRNRTFDTSHISTHSRLQLQRFYSSLSKL